MASIHNPTASSIWCDPLRREIKPGATIRCEDDEAAECSTHIFVVERDPTNQEIREARKEEKAAARTERKTVRKGGKDVEQSAPPAGMETPEGL